MARDSVRDVNDFYEVGSRVSATSFGGGGEVLVCTRKQDAVPFAVKRVVKTKDDCLEGLNQIKALMHVEHPHIIKLVDWFEDDEMLHIIMELARGGDMCERIIGQKRLPEEEAAITFIQLLTAVNHMHSKGIVHVDIKPENIIYEDIECKNVKLADFGFAQFVGEGTLTHCGTRTYSAPEIREQRDFDTKADMWSMGVLLYTMLSGGPPFTSPTMGRDGKVRLNFAYKCFQTISPSAIDLIQKLIVYDPKQRFSAAEALEHRWFTEKVPESMLRITDQHHEDDRMRREQDARRKREQQDHERREALLVASEALCKIYERFVIE